MREKLVLIDGHSILFRAFYGMPLSMTGPDGLHTNALYGFLSILNKIIDDEKPDYLAVAFDLPEPTFRHELYSDYKGNRGPAPDEFREQVPVMKQLLSDMEIPVVTASGFEADDILGTLAKRAEEQGVDVVIISGDRDLLQIASEHTLVVIPKTKGGNTTYERYTPADVTAAFGVTPEGFIELKALMGDSSDNIPGLPGVGPKTASRILAEFGTIENAKNHVDEIKPKKAQEAMRDSYDKLLLSRELVTIRKDAPAAFSKEEFRAHSIYTKAAYESFKRLGFKSLLGRFAEDQQEIGQSREYRVIQTASELKNLTISKEPGEKAGLSLLFEKGTLYAAGVVSADGTAVLVPGEELPENELCKVIAGIMSKAGTAASVHMKRILRYLLRSGWKASDLGCGDMSEEIRECRLFDNVIAAYLLDPLKSDWAYDAISSAYLGRNVPSADELIGKKGLAAAAEADFDKLLLLAAAEAETAYDSLEVLAAKLRETGMTDLFETVEMPLVHVLAFMENEGILVSAEELEAYGNNLSGRIGELTALIYEEAGESFNINSPKQLGQILFEKLHLPGGKKTKTGFSTAADVLEKLAPEHPVVEHILEYRTLTKLKSTYADGLAAYIDPDGRIRTTFHQTITATGRLSSSDPNLQNIPMREELGRMIRKCFYPSAGCVFVDADYSQIELRILAHMSGDEKLIDAYREAKDIHRITASQVFHVPFDEVTDLMRRNAKAVNFGIVYGISSFGLSQGLSITRKEAQEYITKYFETYPKIKSFLDGLVASAKENGYAVSEFGRRRPIPELRSSNFMQRSFGERAAMNSPIQGTAADIMKIAMNRVYRRLQRDLPEAKLILQIHDELLVEVPEALAEEARRIVSEEMEKSADLRVKLETDSHIGKDWYEAK
ncbi:MAG: DNA polymerase I [Lachnospiraceae bacterium]|nr:DNA polymerase I [Lachnospiraceae bacterium]